MRPLEWLAVATSLLAVGCLLPPQSLLPAFWLAVAAAVLVLLHDWLEGMHWQMAPAYLGVALTLFVTATGITSPRIKLFCGILAGAMLAASIVISWILPMFKLPVPSGKYPVGTRTLYFTDPNRMEMHEGAQPGSRQVVAQLWYPAATSRWKKAMYRRPKETTLRSSYQAVLRTHSLQDAPVAAGRFPVIVHNSAWWGFRNRNTFMTQDLASHGFIVASISHPYNSSMVEMSDGTVVNPDYSLDLGFSMTRHIPIEERFAMADEELIIQTADCRFVLDEFARLDRTAGHWLEAHVDMDRVGTYGYSFGGAVCVELAREDHRVKAALELDGVLHGGAAAHGLAKPVLMLDAPWMLSPGDHTEVWAPRILGQVRIEETSRLWNTIAESKARLLEQCGGRRIIIEGLGHGGFTDQIFMSPLRRLSSGGSVAPKRVAHILNSFTLAFFRETLFDEPSPLLAQDARAFPEATVQEWRSCVQ